MSRRFLRISLTIFVILAFTGFFAFTTFLFNPFEGDYEYDVASLVPRDVDVYLSKANLKDDFDSFPKPAFADDFLASKGGQAVAKTVKYRNLMAGLAVEEAMEQVNSQLSQLPISVEPLELFGGDDAVLAAYLPQGDFGTANWIITGRIDWKTKLGLSLLERPTVLGLDKQGISVEPLEDGAVTISGGQIPKPITLWRKLDVLVISNQAELVTKAQELEASRGQNSFLQSARYADQIQFRGREGDELELFCDWAVFSKAAGVPENVPDPNSDEFFAAYFGRLLALHSVRELAGSMTFDNGITLRLNGPLSTEKLTAVQRRLHHQKGVSRERVQELARMAPADTGVFGVLGAPVDDLVNQALLAIERSARQLVDDAARSVWGYPDVTPLVEDLDEALGNRIGFIMRDLDYPPKIGDPPNDGASVPAWCLVFAVENASKVDTIKAKIVARPGEFGLAGNDRGSVFTHPNAETGVEVTEFWSPLIPGTGHLAALVMGGSGQGGTYLLVGNHYQLVQDCLRNYYLRDNNADLESQVGFKTMLNAGLGSASLQVFLAPRAITTTTGKLAAEWAKSMVVIDWETERPRIERRILMDEYGEAMATRYPNDLPSEVQTRLDQLYGPAADSFERDFRASHNPKLRAEYQNGFDAVESVDPLLFQLLLQEKKFELYLRALMPLDPTE